MQYYYYYPKKNYSISMRFKSKTDEYFAYDIIYLLKDIYTTINFGNILDHALKENDEVLIDSILKSNNANFRFNNEQKISKDIIKIERINNGSIEIILSGLSIFSVIIIFILEQNIRKKESKQRLQFEVYAVDNKIDNVFQRYKDNWYGSFSVETMSKILIDYGYEITITGEKSYKIFSKIKKISNRMIKTIEI